MTRLGLGGRFDTDPELVLAALRGPGEGLSREYLFALSELSFYHAAKSHKPESFLASAVYAYAFGLGRTDEARLDSLDPLLCLAVNLSRAGQGCQRRSPMLGPDQRRGSADVPRPRSGG